jgi:hypothetical protein
LHEIAADRWTLVYVAAIGVLLAYELVLALTVPPNNWDSLTYHLARVAAWYHHGGIYWVPNAPTDRINEFQPLAEQEVLYLFVATGGGALFALPQLVALLAAMTAIFVAARRLGFGLRGAACAGLLFSTLSVVALEATTAQNDLVAASMIDATASVVARGRVMQVEVGAAGASTTWRPRCTPTSTCSA